MHTHSLSLTLSLSLSGILLSQKKKEILPFATTWVDLESIMLSDKSDKKRQILYDIIYMWNIKIYITN